MTDFTIKGTIYLGVLEDYSKRVPGGLDAVFAKMANAETIAFLKQRFLPSSWYDIFPLMALNQGAERASGIARARCSFARAHALWQSAT